MINEVTKPRINEYVQQDKCTKLNRDKRLTQLEYVQRMSEATGGKKFVLGSLERETERATGRYIDRQTESQRVQDHGESGWTCLLYTSRCV